MQWTADRGLRARMVATILLAGALSLAAAVTVYAAGLALVWAGAHLGSFPPAVWLSTRGLASPVAAGVAVLFLGGVGFAELRLGRGLGLPAVDARRASRRHHPQLAGAVDRLVQQFGCGRPTVAVTDRQAPLAMTTGLSSATLVVSTGLLELLDEDELEAVVAHELAHVANRDAAVMTAVALPMVVADAVRDWSVADDDLDAGDAYAEAGGEVNPAVYLLAAAFWLVGRVLVARLAQYRELAADRAAATATGSPAAFASALETLSRAEPVPHRESGSRSAVDAFAIVPDTPQDAVTLGPEGERRRAFAGLRGRLRRLFRTHPTLERRLAALRDLEADVETADTA